MRLQLQPLTTAEQFPPFSFSLLRIKQRKNLNKAGANRCLCWSLSLSPSIIFQNLILFFFPGEESEDVFFLLFDSDLCYLVYLPPPAHCVAADLRSSVTVNYATLETDDQQELWNRESTHGGD